MHSCIAATPARLPESVKDLARARPFLRPSAPASLARTFITTAANAALVARIIATKRALGIHRGLPDQPRAFRLETSNGHA